MKPLHILLIEDDSDDIELLQDALEQNNVQHSLHVIKDGGSVYPYLLGGTIPDVIVMDFNLPKIHGRDVLKAIKNNDKFKNVPVVILTTSSSPNDIDYSYKEGASKYLIKPVTSTGFAFVVQAIMEVSGSLNK